MRSIMETIKEKQKNTFGQLKDRFEYKNALSSPRLDKIVVSVGTGKLSRADKKKNDFISERLSKITGQKPVPCLAKKSIASFKLREGEPIGFSSVLRREKMYNFLDRLFNVVIPRIRDFRGFDKKGVDQMGNLTLGIREHNTFPETAEDDLKDVFGLAITIVTTAKNRDEALAFLETLGVPFKR
jgi:large subunit ribosomal protein L5